MRSLSDRPRTGARGPGIALQLHDRRPLQRLLVPPLAVVVRVEEELVAAAWSREQRHVRRYVQGQALGGDQLVVADAMEAGVEDEHHQLSALGACAGYSGAHVWLAHVLVAAATP